jgi:hypothetical protein
MLNKRYLVPTVLLAALILLILGAVALPGPVLGSADRTESLPFDGRVSVIAVPGDGTTRYVPPPERALRAPATADIQVTFGPGFPLAAQQAFDYAAAIWESLITSPVTILVQADWADLGDSGILGQAGPSNIFRNFPGAPMDDTWYPSALADKLAGTNLGGLDFEATFNSTFPDWYFGTDGNPPSDKLDFTSVVLHEMGHGLGFLGYLQIIGSTAYSDYQGSPFVYNRFTETGSGASLLALDPDALYQAVTGGNVYFDGPNARVNNSGQTVKLYAPATWRPGSSYSHVDDIYDGTPNALMTWSLSGGEALHNPGPIALGILWDTGWTLETDPPTVEPPPTSTNTSPAPTATNTVPAPTPTQTVTPLANPLSYGFMPQALNNASKNNITPPPPPTSTPGGPTATATNTGTAPTATATSTSPSQGSIYGIVREAGLPASGVDLALRHYDAGTALWSTVAQTTTGANGGFAFTNPPALDAGDSYYVLYRNDALQIGRLWLWQTRYLASYTAGQTVHIGDFDIADVQLLNPPPFASISLPATFSWLPRSATPTDSYSFSIYDELVETTEFITLPLGYVGSYTLQSFPTDFTSGVEYLWDVYVFTPDFDLNSPWTNGWGWSLVARQVYFNAPTLRAEAPAGLPAARSPAGVPVDLSFKR